MAREGKASGAIGGNGRVLEVSETTLNNWCKNFLDLALPGERWTRHDQRPHREPSNKLHSVLPTAEAAPKLNRPLPARESLRGPSTATAGVGAPMPLPPI
jgi:hypothetical protein